MTMVPPAATYALDAVPEMGITSFILPERLTPQGVGKRRAAYGKLVAREAAAADCETFKGRTSHLHKPLARRWDRGSLFPYFSSTPHICIATLK